MLSQLPWYPPHPTEEHQVAEPVVVPSALVEQQLPVFAGGTAAPPQPPAVPEQAARPTSVSVPKQHHGPLLENLVLYYSSYLRY
jgi:hypothetical protein